MRLFLAAALAAALAAPAAAHEVKKEAKPVAKETGHAVKQGAHETARAVDSTKQHLDVKAALLGPVLTLPVSRGRLALGTWQGIYLCEHRDRGGARSVVATIWGPAREE